MIYEPGDTLGGRYEILQRHAGGMGLVYLCMDKELKMPFALKTLQDDFLENPDIVRRFTEEAHIWLHLGYQDNIVRAEEVDIINGKPYIKLQCFVTEQGVPGNLRTYMRDNNPDEKQILEIAMGICLGMAYIRSRIPGFVHRDLKPENVMMTIRGVPKITDFGVSRALAVEAGKEPVLGTEVYMAPEQLAGAGTDTRSDIFALGCILFELLEKCSYNLRLLEKEKFKRTPSDLREVISKCLCRQPGERYGDFSELGQVLDDLYASRYGKHREFVIRHEITYGLWMGLTAVSFKRALAGLKAADNRHIRNSCVNLSRAVSLNRMGYHLEALENTEQYIAAEMASLAEQKSGEQDTAELKKNLSVALVIKGNCHALMGQGKPSTTALEAALAYDPENQNAWYNLGETCFNLLHNSSEALVCYKKALGLWPGDAMALASMGFVLWETGNIKEGEKKIRKALAIDPSLQPAWGNLGGICAEKGNMAEALICFDKVLALNPVNIQAWNAKAQLYHHMGKKAEAGNCMKKSLELRRSRGQWNQKK